MKNPNAKVYPSRQVIRSAKRAVAKESLLVKVIKAAQAIIGRKKGIV